MASGEEARAAHAHDAIADEPVTGHLEDGVTDRALPAINQVRSEMTEAIRYTNRSETGPAGAQEHFGSRPSLGQQRPLPGAGFQAPLKN